ncbi:MAG: PD40 domain-containing protein [Verrucomicrobiae bacterium]|nr:PD40 domain-containing protein [Verrucomicrobiae bacterium]
MALVAWAFGIHLAWSASPEAVTLPGTAHRSVTPLGSSHAPELALPAAVVFVSAAPNLTPAGGNGHLQIYLHRVVEDRSELVSANPRGRPSTGPSTAPSVSADGRYIAFMSEADDLLEGLPRGLAQVHVFDTRTRELRLISRNAGGVPGNGPSIHPRMAPDGSGVLFESAADNLVPGDMNGAVPDLHFWDRATDTVVRVSSTPSGESGNAGCSIEDAVISHEGRWVAFVSRASDLAAGDLNGARPDVFLWNRDTATVRLVSRQVEGSFGDSRWPRISDDGRHVAFLNTAANLDVPGIPNRVGVVYAVETGEMTAVPAPSGGGSTTPVAGLGLSGNGRYVVLQTFTGIWRWDRLEGTYAAVAPPPRNLAGISHDGRFVYSFGAGPAERIGRGRHFYRTDLVEADDACVTCPADGDHHGGAADAVVSADGHWVAFESDQDGWVADDRNSAADIFLRRIGSAEVRLISRAFAAGFPAPVTYGHPRSFHGPTSRVEWLPRAVSADGRHAILLTQSPGTPSSWQFAAVDALLGTVTPVTVTPDGMPQERGEIASAQFAEDGTVVVFASASPTMVEGDANRAMDVFERDLVDGTTRVLSATAGTVTAAHRGGFGPVVSPTGRHVAFVSQSSTLTDTAAPTSPNVYLHDRTTRLTRRLTRYQRDDALTFETLRFAPDGGTLFLVATLRGLEGVEAPPVSTGLPVLYACQVESGVVTAIGRELRVGNATIPIVVATQPHASQDGSRVAFNLARGPWTPDEVGVLDRATGETRLASVDAGGFPIDGATTGLGLSLDGRWLLMRTLDAGVAMIAGRPGWQDRNNEPDLYLRDLHSGSNLLVSVHASGNGTGTRGVRAAALSPLGTHVAFVSLASDLVEGAPEDGLKLYLRDLRTGTTWLLGQPEPDVPSGNPFHPVWSGDGRVLFYERTAPAASHGRREVCRVVVHPADTDGDGLDDDWEMARFGGLDRDGTGDADGDGISDRDEFLSGTDPMSPASGLRILIIESLSGGWRRVVWQSVPGRNYRVEFREALGEGAWQSLGTVSALGSVSGIDDLPPPGIGRRFYRVVASLR